MHPTLKRRVNLLYRLRRHGITAITKERVILIPYGDNPWRFPQVHRLNQEYNFNMEKGGGGDAERIEFNKKSADRLHEDLERCRLALRDVLEDIAECQNNRDMVTGVDAALGQVSYDLIYERKTDKDYD